MSESYEYFNLAEVDPSFKPITRGVRQLKLTRMEAKVTTPKSGKMANQETIRIPATFVVCNDEDFSGRRLYQTFWIHNVVDQKSLRRLADAVGVMQEPGETMAAYVGRLAEIQPEFKVFVDETVEKDRNSTDPNATVPTNKISWSTVQPI